MQEAATVKLFMLSTTDMSMGYLLRIKDPNLVFDDQAIWRQAERPRVAFPARALLSSYKSYNNKWHFQLHTMTAQQNTCCIFHEKSAFLHLCQRANNASCWRLGML